MAFWFLLLLGIATYLIIQRSVAQITRTPVWLLWLVLMTPALILSAWTLRYGVKQPPPPTLIIWPSIVCLLLYWLLFHWGRRPSSHRQQSLETDGPLPDNAPSPSVPVRPIEQREETQLRNCFPWSVYYIQNIEYRPQAVICRGQLRTTSSSAYQQIKSNIEAQFGDRFLIIFQEGLNDKPFFVLVPNTQLVKQSTNGRSEELTRPGLAMLLLIVTLFTTTLIGTRIAGVDLKNLESDLRLLCKGLPYSLGLMTILGIHELGHYVTARYYKIRATLPYFIPIPFFLGTFGAFMQMRSPIPNRKALFDVSIAGPIAGFIVTLPLLLWGLAHSQIVPLEQNTVVMFNSSALDPKYSLLLALLSKLVLGSQLTLTSAINLHPVAIAGFLGLMVTALNLIPVGQLDGGHIIHAMFGQRTAIIIGQIACFLLLLLSLSKWEFWFWTIIVFFMPLIDEPALNDVTGLDSRRDFLGLLAMTVLVLIVIPLPQLFARWLLI